MIWRCAGCVRVDPSPFTYRELYDMYQGCMEHDWDTANVIWTTVRNEIENLRADAAAQHSGKRRRTIKELDYTKLNQYRF